MAKMSGRHCSIIIRLGISMLRCSTFICVISGSRGVNIIFRHFFVTTLPYQHKETICLNFEFKMLSIFFLLKVLYFFQHFIIYVSFYITL